MSRLVASVALGLVVLIGCGGSGREPTDLRLGAATDTTVELSWVAPGEGTPDAYMVYFRQLGETAYSFVAETTVNYYVHDPHGMTGWYRVAARFGEEIHECATSPATVPVRTDTIALAELNAAGNSGYGWSRSTGAARTYSVRSTGSRDGVDLYVTDFKPAASNQLPYSIASPDMGPADLGGVVPTDSWRVTRFTDPLADEQALPVPASNSYFSYVDVTGTPRFIGCRTEDGYYALVKVTGVDLDNSWLQVETWFQTVRGLRLIRH